MKKRNLILYFTFVILFLPTISFAFFCPTNFNQISEGYTIEQVIQLCGKPETQDTKTTKAEGPQEWSYMVPQAVASPPFYNVQGTLKTDLVFDVNGKVVNISVNGIGVGSTSICGGYNVQLGDTRDEVKRFCGEPAFINKNANPNTLPPDAQKETKVTTFIYNSKPNAKLIFENGILKRQE